MAEPIDDDAQRHAAHADRVLRRLQALPELTMRTRVLREVVLEGEPQTAVELLGTIVERCLFGVAPGEDAMLALIPCLLELHAARARLSEQRRHLQRLTSDGEPTTGATTRTREAVDPEGMIALWERLRELYELASAARGDDETSDSEQDASADAPSRRALRARAVCRVLAEPPPHRKAPPRADRLGPRWGRQITLGERKAMAAGGDRAVLEKLLYDRDPSVIGRLCLNPRVLEQDVLFLATRRPNDPAVLREIARSPWLKRYSVRHALALNPYAETGLVLRLLPMLHAPELAALRFTGDVHPMVRQSAAELVQWRALGLSA